MGNEEGVVVSFGFATPQTDIEAILGDVHSCVKLRRRCCGIQELPPPFPFKARPCGCELPSCFTKGPRQLCSGSLLKKRRARRPFDFLAVLVDQGRSRPVAPTRPILRPQTRYKGRSCYISVLLEQRPEDGGWKLVHRHEDPISTPQLASCPYPISGQDDVRAQFVLWSGSLAS